MGLTAAHAWLERSIRRERLRRPSMNYLEYQHAVEDPKVLTKPWTSAWRTYSLGSEDLPRTSARTTRLSISSKR
jgi:hypothetical protein